MKATGLSRVVLLDEAAPVDKGKARPHSVSDRPCPSTKERNTRTMDPSLDTFPQPQRSFSTGHHERSFIAEKDRWAESIPPSPRYYPIRVADEVSPVQPCPSVVVHLPREKMSESDIDHRDV